MKSYILTSKARRGELAFILLIFMGSLMVFSGMVLLVLMSHIPLVIATGIVILILTGFLFIVVGVARFSIPTVAFVGSKEELLHLLSPSYKMYRAFIKLFYKL